MVANIAGAVPARVGVRRADPRVLRQHRVRRRSDGQASRFPSDMSRWKYACWYVGANVSAARIGCDKPGARDRGDESPLPTRSHPSASPAPIADVATTGRTIGRTGPGPGVNASLTWGSLDEDTRFHFPLVSGLRPSRTDDRARREIVGRLSALQYRANRPHRLRITLAVAGFSMDDLQITQEDNQLVIRGRQTMTAGPCVPAPGIAARQFQRAFVIAEGIEVKGAWIDNGLLHVDLGRPQPEARVRRPPDCRPPWPLLHGTTVVDAKPAGGPNLTRD